LPAVCFTSNLSEIRTLFMKEYEKFAAEDFAMDESFIRWVSNPDLRTQHFWQSFLIRHPDKHEAVEDARRMVEVMQGMPFREDAHIPARTDFVWQRIQQHTNHASQTRARPLLSRTRWLGVAATLVGFALLGTYYFLNRATVYETAYGETRQITLPDGSAVTLNANSTLELAKNWQQRREVWLEGEAFFNVRKIKAASEPIKFTVHAADADIEVLGTQFNVDNRRDQTVVVLEEGKVRLALGNETVMMQPGEWVKIANKKVEKKSVRAEIYRSWTRQEWLFEDAPLDEVIVRIEEAYGKKVVLENDSLRRTTVTGVVPTQDMNTLLQALSALLNTPIVQQGDQIIIE
jgi:transmembrane sensor